MKIKPEMTLADVVYQHTFPPRSPLIGTRDALVRARKFVLDKSMSAYMADLGWEAYRKYPERRLEFIEAARVSARLPHATTWIEWDEMALANRARAVHGSTLDPNLTPTRSGWLLMQHPQLDTAFVGLSFGIGGQRSNAINTEFAGPNELGVCPIGFAWSTTDSLVPWPPLDVAVDLEKKRRITMAGMLTGIADYRAPLSVVSAAPFITVPQNVWATRIRQQIEEQYGMLRYLFALLATINDLPISVTEVRSAKGFVARGRYRKFLSHSVITLRVPEKRFRALARRSVAMLRRRAHQVRGHWRLDWRFPGARGCDHQWTPMQSNETDARQECRICKARRMWITEHQRGDASLGFVVHDYSVTHEGADVAGESQ